VVESKSPYSSPQSSPKSIQPGTEDSNDPLSSGIDAAVKDAFHLEEGESFLKTANLAKTIDLHDTKLLRKPWRFLTRPGYGLSVLKHPFGSIHLEHVVGCTVHRGKQYTCVLMTSWSIDSSHQGVDQRCVTARWLSTREELPTINV
jgi:hypothetical protein